MNFNTHILNFLISFSFILNIAFSTSKSSVSNSSVSYLLSCGVSSPSKDFDGRNWIPDTKFLSFPTDSIAAAAKSQDPALPSTVPYMNARIFKAKSTYKFPISSTQRHWIRLHFYPATFNNFTSSDAYFSVKADNFILLNNFSAHITALALTQAYIIREFSITPIQSGSLELTFNPSQNGSFAFINGIEIISMPEIFNSTPLVGMSDHTVEAEHSVLQTIVRLNVGGQYIPPSNDSGLTRTWYDDSPYLSAAALGVTSEAVKNVTISFPDNLPEYIAPLNVYKTARSMGPNPNINKNFNISWEFRVDANFTYLVRLHFCDYQLSKINQRVFEIFLNNQTAFPSADVIAWSGGQGVPMYKDFAIYVRDGKDDEAILIELRPNVDLKPQFLDAILNGIEIFKVNDKHGNLAGPNPVPSLRPPVALTNTKSNRVSARSKHRGLIVGIVLGGVAGFGLLACVVFLMRRKMFVDDNDKSNSAGWLPIYGSPLTSRTKSNVSRRSSCSSVLSTLGGGFCRHFTLSEIKLGTNNFDESNVIGVGGFGKVYKGIVDGRTYVAIKRANPSSEQGVHEFQTEIDLLSKLRHRHLVSLIGACEENEEMILVYDYMANGTLREHLHKKTGSPPLSWKKRLDICIGAARGLHYLHTGAKYTIIHRDVKSTNILLDEKWVAKVSDFGLSKTGPYLGQTHVSTMVKGSFGYLDPEYFRRQQLTEKSDVYSFGVVLFEVLCGRPALNASLPKEQVSLADWALKQHEKGIIENIVDPNIVEEINQECLTTFVETSVKCLCDQGMNRPSMGTVLWNLEYARQLQNNPDGPKMVAEQKANDAYVRHASLLSIEEEGGEVSDESGGGSELESSRMWSINLDDDGEKC